MTQASENNEETFSFSDRQDCRGYMSWHLDLIKQLLFICPDITVSAIKLFLFVGLSEGQSITELAIRADVEHYEASRYIGLLGTRGFRDKPGMRLVKAVPDLDCLTAKQVFLTEKGRSLLLKCRQSLRNNRALCRLIGVLTMYFFRVFIDEWAEEGIRGCLKQLAWSLSLLLIFYCLFTDPTIYQIPWDPTNFTRVAHSIGTAIGFFGSMYAGVSIIATLLALLSELFTCCKTYFRGDS